MNSDRHTIAAQFGLLKILTGKLAEAKKEADAQIREGWHPKDRAAALLPDGTDIGTVTLSSGKSTARLSDEMAFVAWVERVHPDEMETVTIRRVKPDYAARLLSAARQIGRPVDAETGEEVPGIQVQTGDPFPAVRLAPGAEEAVAAAWADGSLVELVTGLLPAPAIEDRP